MSNSIESRIASQRAVLVETLDAIEEKFDIPKQVGQLTERAKNSYEKNPVPWIVGATAVAIAVAGIVAWALLSDDD